MQVKEILEAGPVMPVIVIDDVAQAVPLAKALVAGGIRVLEVTFRTAAAEASIAAIAEAVPEAIVGAGTLTSPDDFARAARAGAKFGVSPGATAAMLAAGKACGFPFLPGVMTPSDVLEAMAFGYEACKLFPAAQAGGLGMLKAMGGPFPNMLFCPTGGISLSTAPEFLALPNVACVGGSWLAPKDKLIAGDWAGITALAAEAAALARR